jgi:hypothetical protein
MSSYVTSYNSLFTRDVTNTPTISRIEIPLFQRDYAQGRMTSTVQRIRTSFLDVLHKAVTGGSAVSLDFVYGDVDAGTLRPLDGQQRLTTLFLLHWYLAFRAERTAQFDGWKNFSYATRASARLFCKRLANCQPPPAEENLSAWIKDQPWYLYTWRHDPTIQSMLVVLDAMHERFRGNDCVAAWESLVDAENPKISFQLLPIEQMSQRSADLYIKMNSRGKPLTAFENFKARFEQVLEESCPDQVEGFAIKVDGVWSDLFWPYRGADFIVDDEFLRYFRFITEVCEWHDGGLGEGDNATLAERVYGESNPQASTHLDFMFQALDTWVGCDIPSTFSDLFVTTQEQIESDETSKVSLFGQQGSIDVNLFSVCCHNYGETRGRNRMFSWPNTIILFAVLLHRIHRTEDFSRRLRVLRNLVEASSNELRLENMPALVQDVRRIILDGTLGNISAFNQTQVADEQLKEDFIKKNPDLKQSLYRLEDHPELRGCLSAFDLNEKVFELRAKAFIQIFVPKYLRALTGALLAIGDYSRRLNHRMFQLGSGSNLAPWRELLTGAGRMHLAATRDVLGHLLDAIAEGQRSVQCTLDAIQNNWLNGTGDVVSMGWRWYFVKYPAMREGGSGIYVGSNGMLGYSVCMLDRTRMSSWYRDPYLLAIYYQSGIGDAADDPWFTGYETEPRYILLKQSGTGLMNVGDGLILKPPFLPAFTERFSQICANYEIGADYLLRVPQIERNGYKYDIQDRILLGAALLHDLVRAGL